MCKQAHRTPRLGFLDTSVDRMTFQWLQVTWKQVLFVSATQRCIEGLGMARSGLCEDAQGRSLCREKNVFAAQVNIC
jgi:hypothetical protein